jgi:hypothetical protein
MKITIKSCRNGNVMREVEAEGLREAVLAIVKARESLVNAYLPGIDLSGSDLTSAKFSGADLSSANFSCSNLSNADLSDANLNHAIFGNTNLYGASLCRSDLSDSNLSVANLRSANLSDANLRKARLPSPTMVLMADWGKVSDELCADLMQFDAQCHGDPDKFTQWAIGWECPYSNVKYQRAAIFVEKRKLWGKGKVCTPFNLMSRLMLEKTKGWES